MNEKEYEAALDAALKWAGAFDGWNKRFREGLEREGLKLVPEGGVTEPGFYVWAPWPTTGKDGKPISVDEDPYSWPIPSWVVPR